MTASLNTPSDIVNVALTRIGWKQRIASLYDGSAAAQLCLSIYGQTRDEMLREMDPDFAEGNAALALLKSAPPGGYIPGVTPWDPALYPPVGWLFEYDYPADCLKVRAVKPTPLFFPNMDPQPNTFAISNDGSYTPAMRVILCNVSDALIVYTRRVVDPRTMDVGFLEAFTEELGERLAPALTGLDAAKAEAAEGQAGTVIAELEAG